MRVQPGTLISMKKQKINYKYWKINAYAFCLKLEKVHHISQEFKSINRLPTSNRVDQRIKTVTNNFVNTFKHNVKKHFLTWITNNVFMRICVSVFIYIYIHIYIYV